MSLSFIIIGLNILFLIILLLASMSSKGTAWISAGIGNNTGLLRFPAKALIKLYINISIYLCYQIIWKSIFDYKALLKKGKKRLY